MKTVRYLCAALGLSVGGACLAAEVSWTRGLKFERSATESRLHQWCADHGIDLV